MFASGRVAHSFSVEAEKDKRKARCRRIQCDFKTVERNQRGKMYKSSILAVPGPCKSYFSQNRFRQITPTLKFWRCLGEVLRRLKQVWRILNEPGTRHRASGRCLGGVLGSSGGVAGRVWNCFGEPLGRPRSISVIPLADFLAFWTHRGNIKKPRKKTIVFSWIFEVWGRL